jgi:hypothetical protein
MTSYAGEYKRTVDEMNSRIAELDQTPWWRVFRRLRLKGQIDLLIRAAVWFQNPKG